MVKEPNNGELLPVVLKSANDGMVIRSLSEEDEVEYHFDANTENTLVMHSLFEGYNMNYKFHCFDPKSIETPIDCTSWVLPDYGNNEPKAYLIDFITSERTIIETIRVYYKNLFHRILMFDSEYKITYWDYNRGLQRVFSDDKQSDIFHCNITYIHKFYINETSEYAQYYLIY